MRILCKRWRARSLINMRLPRSFFQRPTLSVARDILGKTLVFYGKKGRITEVEAYIGENDPACHAARGKTPRNALMYGPAGFSYVYFIYGMYYCLNIVTERENFPAAVLIRAVFVDGAPPKMTNGPGKVCRFFGITREHSGVDITENPDFFIENSPSYPFEITTSPRVGISEGKELLWRFTVQE